MHARTNGDTRGSVAPEPSASSLPVGQSGRSPAAANETVGKLEVAILAGGCFWGMEEILRKVPGVVDTEVGYTGGSSGATPTSEVKTGTTGQAEAVRIRVRPVEAFVRGPPGEVVFPHARSDDQEPAGQRRRHAVSFGHFRDVARAARGRRARSRARRQERHLECAIVTEIVEAGPFARGRRLPPGLSGEKSDGLHLPLSPRLISLNRRPSSVSSWGQVSLVRRLPGCYAAGLACGRAWSRRVDKRPLTG